ncbi:hypothetical protein U1Q18_009687 [Sarracenia purpurea var. burkii]
MLENHIWFEKGDSGRKIWGNGCVLIYAQRSAKNLVDQPIWETAELIKSTKRNATDWRHLGHSTVDFGWGGPVTVLQLSRNLLGGGDEPCFFLPYYSSANDAVKDGFRVLVYLQESAVPDFRAAMGKFEGRGGAGGGWRDDDG